MCGLVGWISSEKNGDSLDRRKFMEMALILDTIRGGDSTGIFTVNNWWKADETPWANWEKQCTGGHEFVISPEFKKLFENGGAADYKFAVGHNRSATVGGVVIDAAHPFQEGPITLVHNGTVKKEFTNEIDLANDSHGICWRLSKDKPEEVIKSLDGAFALIWHDARDDSLNFVRNKERPLHMAKSKGNDTIYFASEGEMLYWLDNKLKLGLQDIVSMKPAHWLKFKGPKLMVPEVKQVELYSPPKAATTQLWDHKQWSGTGKSKSGWTNSQDSRPTGIWRGTGSKPKSVGNEIPEQVQERLLDYNLFVENEEEFIPLAKQEVCWHGKDRSVVSVLGWLMPVDKTWSPIPCVLHGINPTTFENAKNRKWTVHPVGIMKLSWKLPCVVARLRGTFDMNGKLTTIPEDSMPPMIGADTEYHPRAVYMRPSKERPDVPFDDIDNLTQQNTEFNENVEYPGPNHRMLSASEWLVATNSGCMSCGNPLSIQKDAWNMTWVGTDTGTRPLCGDCRDIQSTEGDDDIIPDTIIIPPGGTLGDC